jgi:hypothetical protein
VGTAILASAVVFCALDARTRADVFARRSTTTQKGAVLCWYTDYTEAWRQADAKRQKLFVLFHEKSRTRQLNDFLTNVLGNREVRERLADYVLAVLPLDATTQVNGKRIQVVKHASMQEMLGRPGFAIVDFQSNQPDLHGHVVSTFPFTDGKYYSKERLLVALNLPEGTLTQRTMIFAVRVHPEAPQSTTGTFSNVLAEAAESHSKHQARINLQGHHNWESRFHRISARLPSGLLAQEVVAESWPGETLVEAAEECVHSWRQSSGHWSAVRARHRLFGYDMKRGRNGVWYATGIFGRR